MKNRIKTYRSFYLFTFLACSFLLHVGFGSAQAGLPIGLTGNIDISYGESDVQNNNQELLQQKYSLNWQKNYFSQLTFRSSYRYTKTELTQNSSNPIWIKEQQPSFDAIWNTSDFTLSSSSSYRTTDAALKALQLNRNNWSVYFKTKSVAYPILSLRINRDHLYNKYDLSTQNIYENRYQAEINHTIKQTTLHYSFTRRFNENRVRDYGLTQYIHALQLSDVRKFNDRKLTLSSNYSMTYQSQTDERPSDTSDYFNLPILSGIYAQTNNYTLDSLSNIRGLSDGNIQEIVEPIINIGGISLNHNIGVDFGYNQQVSAIYLYLNQYSDKRMWSVYTSLDNMNWVLHEASLEVLINEGYNRYEIIFPNVTTRYIKVVSLDISDIENAFVTEIQALEERTISKVSKSQSSSHLINMNANYNYSKNINSLFDISLQHLPGQFGGKNRDNINTSFSTRYRQTNSLTHNVRLQHNRQYFNGSSQDIKDYSFNYLIGYKPLQRLEFALSSNIQRDYIENMKNKTNQSILLGSKGTPLNGLNVALNLTYSKYIQYLAHMKFNSWNQNIAIDGVVSNSLTMILNYSRRYTKSTKTDTSYDISTNSTTNQYLIGFRYRFTKTIFIRGTININKSIGSYYSQDYMISWNPSQKLSISSQMKNQDDNNTRITKRYNTQVNYKIGRNANIYVSYFINDLTKANGDKNNSIRAGFRSGI